MKSISPEIRLLDELTINKIAAGEVVDRPSSVVKELIENSLDAGATQITIEIINGGKDLIKISDNGRGINKAQLNVAFLRHATSKISSISDLEILNTNGFRGEALAAISAIAKVEIITKTKDDKIGTKGIVENSQVISQGDFGTREGTIISVSELFYNVPARKKFLKEGSKETLQITDIVTRLALVNTHCSFKYIVDGKTAIETSGENSLAANINSIYGKSYLSKLSPINYSDEILNISGYISNTSLYASNRKKQSLYINNRYVKMPSIMYSIDGAYKELLPIGKYPIYILNVLLKAENIDPNIHPAKIEVKVSKEVHIEEVLQRVIRNYLFKKSDNLIPEINDISKFTQVVDYPIESNNYPKTKVFESDFIYRENFISDKEEVVHKATARIPEAELSFTKIVEEMVKKTDEIPNNSEEIRTNKTIESTEEENILDFTKLYPKGVIFETYIFATLDNDLYLIDQHAAHERIQYEKFIKTYNLNSIEKGSHKLSQELLFPEILDLSFEEDEVLWNKINIFNELGYTIDKFGAKTIAIRSFPIILEYEENLDFFNYILNTIIEDNVVDLNERFKDKLAKKACRSAIKAQDKIEIAEINEILIKLNKCDNKYTCPHGRPIFIKLEKYQLEKMFKRVNS